MQDCDFHCGHIVVVVTFGNNLRFDFLFALGRFFNSGRQILQQDILFANVLFGNRACGRAVHLLQKLAYTAYRFRRRFRCADGCPCFSG